MGEDMKKSSLTAQSSASSADEVSLPLRTPRRAMKGIVMQDAVALVSTLRDIVVLDMKSNERQTPLPFLAQPLLTEYRGHLCVVLSALPPDTCVILCGAPDSWLSEIGAAPFLSGSAPVYILMDDRADGKEKS